MILKHGAALAISAAMTATLAFPATSFATQPESVSRSLIASSFSNSLEHAKNSLFDAADHIKQEHEDATDPEFSSPASKLLPYDRTLIDRIGTQAETGHNICCPGFACAFADSIILGVANEHEHYGCGSCVWTNWGGGGTWNRDLGSAQALLKEAYEHISLGYPTVIHVVGTWGEHWLTLIGYHSVTDPSNLSLNNFIALDPWDGAEIAAGENYSLYGDNCQHISDFASI